MVSITTRKPYQTPELVVHGSVEKITESAKKPLGQGDNGFSGIMNA